MCCRILGFQLAIANVPKLKLKQTCQQQTHVHCKRTCKRDEEKTNIRSTIDNQTQTCINWLPFARPIVKKGHFIRLFRTQWCRIIEFAQEPLWQCIVQVAPALHQTYCCRTGKSFEHPPPHCYCNHLWFKLSTFCIYIAPFSLSNCTIKRKLADWLHPERVAAAENSKCNKLFVCVNFFVHSHHLLQIPVIVIQVEIVDWFFFAHLTHWFWRRKMHQTLSYFISDRLHTLQWCLHCQLCLSSALSLIFHLYLDVERWPLHAFVPSIHLLRLRWSNIALACAWVLRLNVLSIRMNVDILARNVHVAVPI